MRPYATDGVRVTIGETEANDRLLDVAATVARGALSATPTNRRAKLGFRIPADLPM